MNTLIISAFIYCTTITPEWYRQCKPVHDICGNYYGVEMAECVESLTECTMDGETVEFCKEWEK